jgi:hypothetical protein
MRLVALAGQRQALAIAVKVQAPIRGAESKGTTSEERDNRRGN